MLCAEKYRGGCADCKTLRRAKLMCRIKGHLPFDVNVFNDCVNCSVYKSWRYMCEEKKCLHLGGS